MSEVKSTAAETPAPATQAIPKNLPIELLPLYDWWKANGSQFVITLLTVLVVAAGAITFKLYRENKITASNQELLKADSLEDLEKLVVDYGSTKAGNAARLRLAKAYYDASKYEESLAAYDACLSKGVAKGFEQIAKLGRAHALEGLNRLDDALAAYREFGTAFPSHYLAPLAEMGVARVYTLQGKKDEAKKLLETLKAKKTGAASWEMAIANLEGVVDRYEPRAARSLFEAADAAAKSVNAPAVKADAPAAAPAVTPAAPAPKK